MRDPRRKWERVTEYLGPDCYVLIAWHDGRPAAGGIVLLGTNSHFTRAAMDREIAGPVRAADALEWAAIQASSARGARWYQMGESSTPGVAAFKERFGAVRLVYDEFISERIPLARFDHHVRGLVKRIVGFEEDLAAPPAPDA
jgi:hypothetical protein